MGHTMEHTTSRKRAYMEQQWGIPWSSNGAGHTMEQQWGIPWSNNGAYHGATMGHTMEQRGILWSILRGILWSIPWSSNGAYHGATMGHTMEYTMSRKRAYMGAAMGHI